MNTGIEVNDKSVNTGDTILFENIGDDAIVNTLKEYLDKGILDAIVIHFFEHTDGLNLWGFFLLPLKNNKPISVGEYYEVPPEDWNEKRHNKVRVEIHHEPRVSFVNDLFRNAKNISFTSDFNEHFDYAKISKFNWKF